MWNLVVVLANNQPGKLAAVTKVLGDNNIDMLMTDIDDEGQYGIIRILTSTPDKARNVLYKSNFTAALTSVALVEVEDRPGELAKLMKIMTDEHINVKHIMGCILERGKRAVFVLTPDGDTAELEEKLSACGVKLLEEI